MAAASQPIPSFTTIPIENLPYFERHPELPKHTLDPSRLPPGRLFVFYHAQWKEEVAILEALEHLAFPPSYPALNALYDVFPIQWGSTLLLCASFPVEFKKTCEKVAKVFQMQMVHQSRVLVLDGASLAFPEHENVLTFKGPRHRGTEELKRLSANIGSFEEKRSSD